MAEPKARPPAKKPATPKTVSKAAGKPKLPKATLTASAKKTPAKKTLAAEPRKTKVVAVKKAATTAAKKSGVAKKPATAKKPGAAKKPLVPLIKTEAATTKSAVTRKSAKLTPEERYRMVETTAYFIAERHGFQGRSDEHWAAAEREIAARLGQ